MAKTINKNSSLSNIKAAQEDNIQGQLSVDVYEKPKEILIISPIAGVELSEINISLTEDILTIEGQRKLDNELNEENYLIQECFWGDFSRSIVLPDYADTANITASYKNGILKITVPKNSSNSKTKLIRIKKI